MRDNEDDTQMSNWEYLERLEFIEDIRGMCGDEMADDMRKHLDEEFEG